MKAALSLEPILILLSTLARDLQSDFLPFIPRILSSYADLVDEGKPPVIPISEQALTLYRLAMPSIAVSCFAESYSIQVHQISGFPCWNVAMSKSAAVLQCLAQVNVSMITCSRKSS